MRSAASVIILLFAVMIVSSARLLRSVCLLGRSWSSLRPSGTGVGQPFTFALRSESEIGSKTVSQALQQLASFYSTGEDRGENRDCLLYRREYVNAIFRF